MPLSLRPVNSLLLTMRNAVFGGGQMTDDSQIGIFRQLVYGVAAVIADLSYDLYTLQRSFYISTGDEESLPVRMRDMGLEPDKGQAASDPVTYTRVQTWIEDIVLSAGQMLQATLADGTVILYRSIGDVVLRPQGRSVSGLAPGTSITGGTNDQIRVNLDGDGLRTLTLGSQGTAPAIATALQAALRALTAMTPGNQPAYAGARVDYDLTTPGAFTLRSGSTGPTSSVVITASTTNDASTRLKLGLAQGGQELPGADSVPVSVLCDTIGVLGNVGAGQIRTQLNPVAGIQSVANPLMFSNGREPASLDANKQDLRSYLLGLGVGTNDALERAVYQTVGSDGQTHVLSAQVLYGAGSVQVYVADGRSLTEGAQGDVVRDVLDELEGRGSRIGGWLPGGTVGGVAPAKIRGIDYDVTVYVGPNSDKVLAQRAIETALYVLIYQWFTGRLLAEAQSTQRIQQTISDMQRVVYRSPPEFTFSPSGVIPAIPGQKLMPRTIVVEVLDA